MKRLLAFVVSASVVLGLAGAALSTSHDVWKKLRRPLQIPHIAAGSQCPASAPDTTFDFAANGIGQGYGPGPAYPVFPNRPAMGALAFDYPPSRESVIGGSKWGGLKVLWFLAPGNGPRVLVRGRQLDGSYGARFGLAPTPQTELRIVGSGSHPATTRLPTGGCYGYQIDGPDYSRVVVFEAKLRCLAAPVVDSRVHAGPFTGVVNIPQNQVVDGRFSLHVGGRTKMGWFLPRKYAVDESGVFVRGVRLAPPGRTFSDPLAEAFSADFPDDQHAYASNFALPTAGCWRLTFTTGRVKGSLVVLVRNG